MTGVADSDASSGSSGSSRPRAAKRAEVQGRADHDGPRRRGQGDPDPDRGAAASRPSRTTRWPRWATPARCRRRHAARDDHRQLRGQADPLPRRLDRRAGGQRHRQRPRRVRRAPAGAEPLARARGGPRRRRAARRGRGDRAPAARAAGVEIVAGDTKVVERGHARRDVRLHDRGRADRPARDAGAPTRCGPGDRILVSGPIGEHGTAIMLARGEFELDAEIESDTRSLWPAVDALLEAAGPALRCMRDATRGGVASVLNELARASRRGDASCARATCRCSPRWPARASSWGSIRCTWRTRARSSPSSRRRRPTRRSRRCASVPGCEEAAEIGEVQDRAAGDGAGGDGVRRAAGDGPARRAIRCRGSVERGGADDGRDRVRTATRPRPRRSPRTSSG